MYFGYFCRMDFKQYMAYIVFLLLLLLTTMIEGITTQCAYCEYFDVDVEMCSSCNIICPRQIRTCLRLCPGKYHLPIGTIIVLSECFIVYQQSVLIFCMNIYKL